MSSIWIRLSSPIRASGIALSFIPVLLALPLTAVAQTQMTPKWHFTPQMDPNGVSLSKDGSMIAVGAGTDVSLYFTSTQLPYRQINPTSGVPSNFTFSPDERTLAFVTTLSNHSQRVELWNFTNGKFLGFISPTATAISSIAFSPSGQQLAIGGEYRASASAKGVLEQWSVASRTRTSRFNTKASTVASVAYSRNGRVLAEGGAKDSSGSLELWDARTGLLSRDLVLGDITGISNLAFPSAGTSVVAMGNTAKQSAVASWNLSSGSLRSEVPGNIPTGNLTKLSPEGDQFITATYTSSMQMGQQVESWTVSLWEISNLNYPVTTWDAGGSVSGAAFSGDASKCAFVGMYFTAYMLGMQSAWIPTNTYFKLSSTSSGTILALGSVAEHHYWGALNAYLAPTFSPSENLVVAGGTDYGTQAGTINVWNSTDGALEAAIPSGVAGVELRASFSADDKWLALSGPHAMPVGVQVWNLETSKLVETFAGNIDPWTTAFAPKGSVLAIAGSDTSSNSIVQLWDVVSGKLLKTLETTANTGISSIAFSKDGTELALAGASHQRGSTAPPKGVVECWNVRTGRRTLILPTTESTVNAVAFSPSGRVLVAAGEVQDSASSTSGRVEVWDPLTGKLTHTMPLYAGTSSASSTMFSANGELLYVTSSGGPGSVQVFDAARAKFMGYLNSGSGILGLSADGSKAATSVIYQGLIVYKVPALETAKIKSIQFSPASIAQWSSTSASVTLSAPAPAGGLTVGIEVPMVGYHYLQTPGTIQIPRGASSASFTIQSSSVDSFTPFTVTALSGPYSAEAILTVNPPSVATFTLSKSSVIGGASVTATLTINYSPGAFSTFGWCISNNSAALIPHGVEFDNGANSASVTVTTSPVTTPQTVTLTAEVGRTTKSILLTVNPPGG